MNTFKLQCGHLAVDEKPLYQQGALLCPVGDGTQPVIEQVNKPELSAVTNGAKPERSYGCSWGCGNPYDYVLISIAGGDTEFLCLVCMLKLMQDMIMAVLNPQDPEVRKAMNDAASIEQAPMTSGRVRSRGRNAPADIDDDDLIEAFDSRIPSYEE